MLANVTYRLAAATTATVLLAATALMGLGAGTARPDSAAAQTAQPSPQTHTLTTLGPRGRNLN